MAPLSSLNRRGRGVVFLLSAVALTTLLWGVTFRSSVATEPLPTAGAGSSLAASKREWQGVASCASTACHGGNGPKGSKGSEYTTWVLYDKHTRAYNVLFDERSKIIEKNFRHIKNVTDAHAETDKLCLSCHAMNAEENPKRESFVRDFGIGCESCHGTAQEWLGVHYASDWKSRSDEDKRKLGFQPMKQLADRAQLCVTCHVGDADKQVNHDLIAAGHPRLNFEFGAFQAIMPKHWREEGDNVRPDFEARAWAVGQIATARAALELLAHRSQSTDEPWPEFAEYDCFACHHDLREPSWRQKPGHYANRTPGSFPWGTWYYAMLPQALHGPNAKGDGRIVSILSELKKEMEKPSPNRNQVAERARGIGAQLGRLLTQEEKRHYERTAVENLFQSIRTDEQKTTAANWDGAAQVYLALAALYNALGDMDPGHRDARMRDSLKARAKQLEFPNGYDSPRGLEPK